MEVKRYKVKYSLNGDILVDNFSCIMDISPLVEINGELLDKYYGENFEVLELTEIEEPDFY